MTHLRGLMAFVIVAMTALPALAQDLTVTIGEGEGSTIPITIENTYEFPVTVVNVRITLEEADGQDVHYYSQGQMQHELAAAGSDGASWSGNLTFAQADGTAADEFVDWGNYDRTSVAAAVDIDAFAPAVQAALDSADFDAMAEQLAFVRSRIPPISRSARFHADQVAASGLSVQRYFDLERMDGMQESLEGGLCEWASDQVVGLRGNQEAKQEAYNALSERMREVGLHINCINTEGRLAAARMLLEGNRPQDALLFKETDEEGNLLEEWIPIYTQANLALARTAAELGVQQFSSIRPALEALNNVYEVAPENAEMLQIAGILVPNAASWVIRASGPIDRDLDAAQQCLEMIRPRWSRFERVEQAAATFADALIEQGLEYCERREYVNSRNRFVRGERILEGIPAWEERAAEINHCRALGALEEGREKANHPTDEEGPERGYAMLEEAMQRHTLSDEEVHAFKADIADAWVNLALRQLENEGGEPRIEAAEHSLGEAEEVSPIGRTDAARAAWIRYAERLIEYHGFAMKGADVELARAALENAEDVDPDRIAAASSKLTMIYYGYRVGIPGAAVLIGLLAGLIALMNKRKAKKFADMDVDDI